MQRHRNHLVPMQVGETCSCKTPDSTCRQWPLGHWFVLAENDPFRGTGLITCDALLPNGFRCQKFLDAHLIGGKYAR